MVKTYVVTTLFTISLNKLLRTTVVAGLSSFEKVDPEIIRGK
jgi:hypothetical protein